MSFFCATDQYVGWLRDVAMVSPATVDAYGSTARQFASWWGDRSGAPTLQELEAFVTRTRRGGRPGTAATTVRDVIALNSFFGWAVQRGLVGENLAAGLRKPPIRNINPKPIPDEDWLTIWHDLRAREHRAWLGLGFFCGLRCAELQALRVHHLDVPSRKLVAFVRKGGGEHTVPVGVMLDVYEGKLPHLRSDLLWPALERAAHGKAPDAPLCDIAQRGQPGRVLDRVLRGTGRRHTPHALRHSAATNLLRANVPIHLVSRLLNHTNVTTTMRYVRAGGDELADWLAS